MITATHIPTPTREQCLNARYHLRSAAESALVSWWVTDGDFHRKEVVHDLEKAATALGLRVEDAAMPPREAALVEAAREHVMDNLPVLPVSKTMLALHDALAPYFSAAAYAPPATEPGAAGEPTHCPKCGALLADPFGDHEQECAVDGERKP